MLTLLISIVVVCRRNENNDKVCIVRRQILSKFVPLVAILVPLVANLVLLVAILMPLVAILVPLVAILVPLVAILVWKYYCLNPL